MTVRIEITASLRKYVERYDSAKGIILSDADGKSVRRLIDELGIPFNEVTSIVINHRPGHSKHVIEDGDVIYVVKAVGGG
jgi:sulfur carrier protein ThiS